MGRVKDNQILRTSFDKMDSGTMFSRNFPKLVHTDLGCYLSRSFDIIMRYRGLSTCIPICNERHSCKIVVKYCSKQEIVERL